MMEKWIAVASSLSVQFFAGVPSEVAELLALGLSHPHTLLVGL